MSDEILYTYVKGKGWVTVGHGDRSGTHYHRVVNGIRYTIIDRLPNLGERGISLFGQHPQLFMDTANLYDGTGWECNAENHAYINRPDNVEQSNYWFTFRFERV